MRIPVRTFITWLTVCALLVSSPAWAQQHVIDSTVLQQAIAEQQSVDAANRQMVERVLARPDVQVVAARLGLDIKDARTAIAGINGDGAGGCCADRAGGRSGSCRRVVEPDHHDFARHVVADHHHRDFGRRLDR